MGETSKDKIVSLKVPKINCWDFVQCGKGFMEEKAAENGRCPASNDISADGSNGGKNGGRICWAIAGTFCEKELKGMYAKKIISCRSCSFFKTVNREEGIYFHLTPPKNP